MLQIVFFPFVPLLVFLFLNHKCSKVCKHKRCFRNALVVLQLLPIANTFA